MRLYKELNIFEDKKLYREINIFSVILLFLLVLVSEVTQFIMYGEIFNSFYGNNFFWGIVLFLLFVPIHELFHGLFFKFFSDSKKVKYGFSKGLFYAANPGVIYTRNQYIVIVLAPFILNSFLFILLAFIGINSALIWNVFILHTAACAGDFWYVGTMLKYPQITYCEDTMTGVRFYD